MPGSQGEIVEFCIIADASPLIYFAKMDQLGFLHQVLGPVGISPAVFRETVVAGQELGLKDAERIAAAIKAGSIVRISLGEDEARLAQSLQQSDPRLGPGECETIACAIHRRLKAILHDKKARRVAANYKVRTMQGMDILFLALLRGYVSLAGFKSLLRELATLTGMDPATLFEREALAEEIAAHLELPPADTEEGNEDNGSNSPT
jgi:predicted nucleic acid-binding protein